MRKSITAKLVGGTVFLLVTIILGTLCFIAGALVEGAVGEDAGYVSALSVLVQRIALGAGTLTREADSAALGTNVASIRSANERLLALLSLHRSRVFEPLLYQPTVLAGFDDLAARLHGTWQTDLGALLAAADIGPQPGDAARAAGASVFVRDSLRILDLAGALSTSLGDSRQSVVRPFLGLFALFIALGALVALGYVIRTIFALRRDFRRLLAETGSDRGSAQESVHRTSDSAPDRWTARDDEIGQLAGRLWTLRLMDGVAQCTPGRSAPASRAWRRP